MDADRDDVHFDASSCEEEVMSGKVKEEEDGRFYHVLRCKVEQ